MSLHLVIDFGSTYTKAVLLDLEAARIIGTGYAPSTVGSDVRLGLAAALEAIGGQVDLHEVPAHACSSAAGGLRILAIGLVPSLSLEAAQRAALGAGAKVVGAYGYKLSVGDLKAITESEPDIVLLAGGTDGGDEEIISHKAEKLAGLALHAPVIVAGNKAVAADCAALIERAGKTAVITPNILPEVDRLNVEPVHAKIREIFMNRIVHAKGIDKVDEELDLADPIVPTPRAILDAAQLLSAGAGDEKAAGEVVVVDIGGATTDVHSISSGAPRIPGVVQRGLPELHAKRTVEGDLGMRVSAPTVIASVGASTLAGMCAKLGHTASVEDIDAYGEKIGRETNFIPRTEDELALDAVIARSAVQLAMTRHAGHLKDVYTATGPVRVQDGKDLTSVAALVGVGGVLANGPHARFILEAACADPGNPFSLLPQAPRLFVDRDYVLFGIGLLAKRYPEQALRIARSKLDEL